MLLRCTAFRYYVIFFLLSSRKNKIILVYVNLYQNCVRVYVTNNIKAYRKISKLIKQRHNNNKNLEFSSFYSFFFV